MFGLFKKGSKINSLEKKYKKLLKEAYELSTIDRKKSDMKQFEAEEVYQKIETLRSASGQ